MAMLERIEKQQKALHAMSCEDNITSKSCPVSTPVWLGKSLPALSQYALVASALRAVAAQDVLDGATVVNICMTIFMTVLEMFCTRWLLCL